MKQNSKYKKPFIPNFNPWALKPGQIAREVVDAAKAKFKTQEQKVPKINFPTLDFNTRKAQ